MNPGNLALMHARLRRIVYHYGMRAMAYEPCPVPISVTDDAADELPSPPEEWDFDPEDWPGERGIVRAPVVSRGRPCVICGNDEWRAYGKGYKCHACTPEQRRMRRPRQPLPSRALPPDAPHSCGGTNFRVRRNAKGHMTRVCRDCERLASKKRRIEA